MGTYLLSMNDTIVVKAGKFTEVCQPCVNKAGTNYNDVTIVLLVCVTVVLLALIAILAIRAWKKAECKVRDEEFEKKKKKEEEESIRKMKADCQEKLLDHLKKKIDILKDKEGKIQKEQENKYNNACLEYENELKEIIKNL